MSSRDKILARRAKFMAAAFASAGLVACSSETGTGPSICLEPAYDGGGDTADSGGADTSDTADTRPMPCLEPPEDSSVMDSATTDSAVADSARDTGASDTFPMPCLSLPPPDGGAP